MGRPRPVRGFEVQIIVAALVACVLGAHADRLAFPKTTDAAIVEEDLEFCRTLAAQARPEPPEDGWKGPLTGVPEGMLVYGKMDSDGDGSAPAAKFSIGTSPCAQHEAKNTRTRTHTRTHTVGTLANVSTAAMIATVEGIDFDERRRWDPSCMLLKPLHTDGEDDVVQWRSVIFVHYPSCTFTYTPGPLAPMKYSSFTCTSGPSAPRKYYSSTLTCTAAVAAPRSDFPWPLSDREFVYRRRLVQDGAGGAIAVTKAIKASSEWLPVEKSVIRIRDFLQYTSVRPLDDGSGCSFAMLCECLGFRVWGLGLPPLLLPRETVCAIERARARERERDRQRDRETQIIHTHGQTHAHRVPSGVRLRPTP